VLNVPQEAEIEKLFEATKNASGINFDKYDDIPVDCAPSPEQLGVAVMETYSKGDLNLAVCVCVCVCGVDVWVWSLMVDDPQGALWIQTASESAVLCIRVPVPDSCAWRHAHRAR
jgi:hypothetical protein